jgi:hypothetical protein
MEDNVKILMETAGCTMAQAEEALSESRNDLNKALELLDAAGKDVIIFQFQFEPKEQGEGRGFLIAALDPAKDSVIYMDMVYPLGGEQAGMLDINMPTTVFCKTMESARRHLPDRHRGLCSSNLGLIKSKMSSAFIRRAIDFHNKAQIDKLNQHFGEVVNNVMGAEFNIQYFARSQSLGSIASLIKPAASAHQASQPSDAATKLFGDEKKSDAAPLFLPEEIKSTSPQDPLPQVVLICEPEISPFEGKPIRDCIEGDEIIVKIKDGRDSARYFTELLGGSVGDELVPLLSPLVKINKMSDTFVEGFVEFGPGIFGQFFIPPDCKVKIKTDSVKIYNPFKDEPSMLSDERMGRQILIGLISLVSAVFLLIVVFLIVGLIIR